MSLRRAALTRRTELRRTPMPRRRSELRARAVKAISRPKATGPTPATRNLVRERAGGCCELCGRLLHHEDGGWIADHSFHHRQPRGAGGSSRPEVNCPSNLLLVCGTGITGCHGDIEKNRDIAHVCGWLVKRPTDPATVPVALFRPPPGVMVHLTDDGRYEEAA